jgi:SagB-type dehydrogenase family enzyme
MTRSELLAGVAALVLLVGGCATQAPRSVLTGGARHATEVALPPPATDGPMSLEQALARRRSHREFRPDPVPLATIGQLLWAGHGITDPTGKRTAPSAGALYPLELYVVTAAVLMHYLPRGHRVEIRSIAGARERLSAAAYGQASVDTAPDIIVVAAVVQRTRVKYGARAQAFADREAGHAAQNILLEATARGLASVPVGSVDPARAASALGLPLDETVLYLIPVGYAR